MSESPIRVRTRREWQIVAIWPDGHEVILCGFKDRKNFDRVMHGYKAKDLYPGKNVLIHGRELRVSVNG